MRVIRHPYSSNSGAQAPYGSHHVGVLAGTGSADFSRAKIDVEDQRFPLLPTSLSMWDRYVTIGTHGELLSVVSASEIGVRYPTPERPTARANRANMNLPNYNHGTAVISRFDSQTCGSLGCTSDAERVIDHPKHGERVVCEGCAGGHEVTEVIF